MAYRIKRITTLVCLGCLAIVLACSGPVKRGVGVSESVEPAFATERLYSNNYRRSTVISIGIDAYRHEDKLRNAVSDAKAIVDLFNSLGYESISLYNSDATRSEIIYTIKTVLENSEANDRIIVFFAGHGTDVNKDANTVDGYLIPVDGRSNVINSLIPLNWLQIDLCGSKEIRAKHILFILDSCSSGIVASRSTISVDPSLGNYISALMSRPARQVITAGTGEQEVLDGGYGQNSFFAGYLIRALKHNEADINNDYHITATELGLYLSQKVYLKSQGLQKPDFAKLLNTRGGEVIVKLPSNEEIQRLNLRSDGTDVSTGELRLKIKPRRCSVKVYDLDGVLLVDTHTRNGQIFVPDLKSGDYQILITADSRDYLPIKLLIGVYGQIERKISLEEKWNNVVVSPVL